MASSGSKASRSKTEFEIINRDIYLYPRNDRKSFRNQTKGTPYVVAASLDTLCEVGSVISEDLIHRLGMKKHVKPLTKVPHARDLHGRWVEFKGTIPFRWKVLDGKTIHDPTEFLVASTDIDLIFGLSYIVQKKLLLPNWSSVVPLVEHKQEPLSEKANRALLEEQQRQARERLSDAQASQPQIPQASGSQLSYNTITNAYSDAQYASNQASRGGTTDGWVWSPEHKRYYRTELNREGGLQVHHLGVTKAYWINRKLGIYLGSGVIAASRN